MHAQQREDGSPCMRIDAFGIPLDIGAVHAWRNSVGLLAINRTGIAAYASFEIDYHAIAHSKKPVL